ncbi:N-formylglutamate amidohydrolase [Roseovarius aquimarinus]|uniref:N-formylglutamate amidohydrolase n=1 Tax=Roseovarius aquimarinus TaxID=1229156 RepID=A0ABW7I6M5_9RHOB
MSDGRLQATGPRWQGGLLAEGEPDAAQVEDHGLEGALSPFVLTCDHASSRVPAALDGLGVAPDDIQRHIGWDIGALDVARHMARAMRGLLIHQAYSRIVIDCNRPPHVAQAFPIRSDGTDIPGNAALTGSGAAARVAEIFHPYHAAIAAALDARAGTPTALLAIHSYTPHHGDFPDPRPWPVSLLFNRDSRFSEAMAAELRARDIDVGMNQPYVVDDDGDYAIPIHAERRGIPHSLIEVRQDLIETDEGARHWAAILTDCAAAAFAVMTHRKGAEHAQA